jgi:phage-related minor tail protein
MNWLKRLWANPNTAIWLATAAPTLMALFPAYAVPIAGVATLLGVHGGLTPEQPVPATTPAGGVMHAQDYAALAAAVAKAVTSSRK